MEDLVQVTEALKRRELVPLTDEAPEISESQAAGAVAESVGPHETDSEAAYAADSEHTTSRLDST